MNRKNIRRNFFQTRKKEDLTGFFVLGQVFPSFLERLIHNKGMWETKRKWPKTFFIDFLKWTKPYKEEFALFYPKKYLRV